jgi:protein TonB
MPVYPPDAKAAKVQGTVVLQATVGKDGHVKTLHIVSGPAMLQQAAEEAVNHWVYKPYLLNGAPVEVTTRINVIFTLADKTTGDKPAKN